MSPTEITRISKWVQFLMTALGLLSQVLSHLPNMIKGVFRKRR